MSKKLFFISLLVFSFNFLLFAESSKVQADLLGYINKNLPEIAKLETESIEAYESVTGNNYKNDKTLYNVLTKTVIPQYKAMIKVLEAVSKSLKTKEVDALNHIYIAASKIQLNGFDMIVEGLKAQDATLVLLANKKLDRSRRLISEWTMELQDLCKEHNVEVNK